MNKKIKGYIELISYGTAALFSAAMFVFGALFPKYMFVEEGISISESMECDVLSTDHMEQTDQIQRLDQLRERLCEQAATEEDIKVTCLSYECLKEIIDDWN